MNGILSQEDDTQPTRSKQNKIQNKTSLTSTRTPKQVVFSEYFLLLLRFGNDLSNKTKDLSFNIVRGFFDHERKRENGLALFEFNLKVFLFLKIFLTVSDEVTAKRHYKSKMKEND